MTTGNRFSFVRFLTVHSLSYSVLSIVVRFWEIQGTCSIREITGVFRIRFNTTIFGRFIENSRVTAFRMLLALIGGPTLDFRTQNLTGCTPSLCRLKRNIPPKIYPFTVKWGRGDTLNMCSLDKLYFRNHPSYVFFVCILFNSITLPVFWFPPSNFETRIFLEREGLEKGANEAVASCVECKKDKVNISFRSTSII